MSQAIELLQRLRKAGISLWREDGRLRFRAAAGVMNDGWKAEISALRPELMELLRQGEASSGPALVRRSPEDSSPPPLTFAQQRLWFLDQLQPGFPAYNVYDVIAIDHALDLEALRRALTEMVRRHEGLRTVFPAVDGVPRQLVLPTAEMPLPVIDLSHLKGDQQEQEWQRLVEAETRAPFNLATGPLLRVSLLKRGPARYTWLLSIHHIVSDDWSKKLINQELEVLYTAFRDGRPSPLPELPIQWSDFAAWQQQWLSGPVLDEHVSYWKGALSGELPTLQLVADHARHEPPTGRNGRFYFPPELVRSLRAFCEAEGVTLFMLLLAGHAALLARMTRQDELVVGTPISDRHFVETEGLIGFLLNTLPLRVRVNGRASFRALLRQVKETCLAGYAYQAVPYEALMHHLQVERTTSGNPLFQTVLALLNTPDAPSGESAGALWGPHTEEPYPRIDAEFGPYVSESSNGTTKFDLSITFIEHREGLWGRTEYNAEVFDESSMAALVTRLQVLLKGAVTRPDEIIEALPWMTSKESDQVQAEWSHGRRIQVPIVRLPEWIEVRARTQPHAIALEDGDECVSYAAFEARSARLAHRLRELGVTLETPVAVLLERSTELFVAVLGAMRAGAACVPLEVTYPDERLRIIVEDAGVRVLVTSSALAPRLAVEGLRILSVDEENFHWDATPRPEEVAPPSLPAFGGEHIACILYTSGSTGRPKGVPISHRALANYAHEAALDYRLTEKDRVLQFASIAFDASWEESLMAWSAGATLVLRPERMIDSTERFTETARALGLTAIVLPTAYWHELVATLDHHQLPESLHCLVIGGERAIPEKLLEWQRQVGARTRVFNTYGPTEGTIAVTRCLFPAEPGQGPVPREVAIGRPVANSHVLVLDDALRPVPPGVPGELYLGGAALTRGYLHRPAMTAERFVPDPFASRSSPGSRLYRTGDLVRFLPDGNLQYLGRVDAQVKIRGYRVEPREIELALQGHTAVKDAVVIAREDVPGERRLVAYIVLREGVGADIAELRAFLKPQLPSYMLPAAFVLLDVLPLNVNGKVAVRALPHPDEERGGAMALVEPRTPTEARLAEIWRAVLQIERLGIEESFFDLGGHSLLATRVIARVNDGFGIDLPLRRLFEAPSIAELAPLVDGLLLATPERAGRDRVVSLRSLREEQPGKEGLRTDHMLAGLEGLSDDELAALVGDEVESA